MTTATTRQCPVCGEARCLNPNRCKGRRGHRDGRTYRHTCACGCAYVSQDPLPGYCSADCRNDYALDVCRVFVRAMGRAVI